MHPRELFEANLGVVERAIAAVCAQASLRGPEAEDFASSVKVALLEDDCAIVRKWEGRSSFATYVTVVTRRLLIDQQRADGRWYASAVARRHGPAAVLLEELIVRDRRSFEEALPIVRTSYSDVTAEQLALVAAALPERAPRPRLLSLEVADDDRFAGPDRADERVAELDMARRAQQASRVVRDEMNAMTAEDRVILRLRFAKGATVADIARALGIPQRPLYRRIEGSLVRLRRALEQAGLGAEAVQDLIGAAGERLDFQLGWKSEGPQPSLLAHGSEDSR